MNRMTLKCGPLFLAGLLACDGALSLPPGVCGNIGRQLVSRQERITIQPCFDDPEEERLVLRAETSTLHMVDVAIEQGQVHVTGLDFGTVQISVHATDVDWQTVTQSFEVEVRNLPPVIIAEHTDTLIKPDSAFTVALIDYFSEPEGEALSFSASAENTRAVAVGFPEEDSSMLIVTGVRNGVSEVGVSARDPYGDSVTLSFTVTVHNEPPVGLDPPDEISLLPDSTFRYALANYFRDLDDATLVYAAHPNNAKVIDTEVLGDTLVVTGAYKGSTHAIVTATDPQDQSATLDFPVVVPNQGPRVIGDPPKTVALMPDSAVEIRLRGHFHDPDDGMDITFAAVPESDAVATARLARDVLVITGVRKGMTRINVTATDPEGESATLHFPVVIPNQPPVRRGPLPPRAVLMPHENAVYNLSDYFTDPDDATLRYVVEALNTGVVRTSVRGSGLTVSGVRKGLTTINVVARDAGNEEAALSFSASVPNQPPYIVSEPSATTLVVGVEKRIPLSNFIRDSDDNDLSYSVRTQHRGVVTARISNSALVLEGIRKGSAVATVTASDPSGESVDVDFPARVPNRKPVLSDNIPDQVIRLNSSTAALSLRRYFRDPDLDPLTFSFTSSNPDFRGELNGTSLRIFGYAVGKSTITARAVDPENEGVNNTFTVEVRNRNPELYDELNNRKLRLSESHSINLLDHFRDPDGQDLDFTAKALSDAVAANVVSTSVLTLAAENPGSSLVEVSATDTEDATTTSSFLVRVSAGPPVIQTPLPDINLEVGGTEKINLGDHFTDPDGGELTYTVRSNAVPIASVSLSGNVLTVSGVGAGVTDVSVKAVDVENLSVTGTSKTTVTQPNRPPQVTKEIEFDSLTAGEKVQVPLSEHFSDPDGDALTYTVSSTDTEVATATENDGVLLVTTVSAGSAYVIVDATDGEFKANLLPTLKVRENRAPIVKGTLRLDPIEADQQTAVSVADYFSDPDGDELTYTATSVYEGTAEAEIRSGTDILAVTGKSAGLTYINIVASDGSKTATMYTRQVVTAVNRPPVVVLPFANIGDLAVGETKNISLSAHIDDPDGDDLEFEVRSSDSDHVTATLGSGDRLSLAGVSAGTVTVLVEAKDTDNAEVEAMFTVTATHTNNAPTVIKDLEIERLSPDSTVEVELLDYFEDADESDTLMFAAAVVNALVTPNIADPPNHDILMVTPVPNKAGSTFLTVTATDPHGASVKLRTRVAVNHKPRPDLSKTAVTVVEGASKTVSTNATDQDEDELEYTVETDDAATATATVTDAGVITITAEAAGEATITVTVKDGTDKVKATIDVEVTQSE